MLTRVHHAVVEDEEDEVEAAEGVAEVEAHLIIIHIITLLITPIISSIIMVMATILICSPSPLVTLPHSPSLRINSSSQHEGNAKLNSMQTIQPTGNSDIEEK